MPYRRITVLYRALTYAARLCKSRFTFAPHSVNALHTLEGAAREGKTSEATRNKNTDIKGKGMPLPHA